VIARFGPLPWLDVHPETGRTHQIRVHLASLGHPIVGDRLYGGRRNPETLKGEIRAVVADYDGLALHAWRLEFTHPRTGHRLRVEAPLPADLAAFLARLKSVAVDIAARR
jgi:23S rRNA pseudouridine1911/1915/1917 synthase